MRGKNRFMGNASLLLVLAMVLSLFMVPVSAKTAEDEYAAAPVMTEESYDASDAGSFNLYLTDADGVETLYDELFYDRYVSTKTIELTSDVTAVRIEKVSGYEVNVDELTINGTAPAGYERKLSATDSDVIEVEDSTTFDISGSGTLVISARAPLTLLSEEYAVRFPGDNYMKDINPGSDWLSYSLDSVQDTLTCSVPDSSELFHTETAYFASGHPVMPVDFYVANDEENLYVFAEVYGDNTFDHGKDHTGVYVLCGQEAKYYAVHTVDENEYGEWDFTYTDTNDDCTWQHMLYLVTIPLDEIADAGHNIGLIFEYYGTGRGAEPTVNFSFYKQDEAGNPIEGAELELRCYDDEFGDYINCQKGVSDENGLVTITCEMPFNIYEDDGTNSFELKTHTAAESGYANASGNFTLNIDGVPAAAYNCELENYDYLSGTMLPEGYVGFTYNGNWRSFRWNGSAWTSDDAYEDTAQIAAALPDPSDLFDELPSADYHYTYSDTNGNTYNMTESINDVGTFYYGTVTTAEGCNYEYNGSTWYSIDPAVGMKENNVEVYVRETKAPDGYVNVDWAEPDWVYKGTTVTDEYYYDASYTAEDPIIDEAREIPDLNGEVPVCIAFYKTDADGEPLGGATLTLSDKSGHSYTVTTDDDGLAIFDIDFDLSAVKNKDAVPDSMLSKAELQEALNSYVPDSSDSALTYCWEGNTGLTESGTVNCELYCTDKADNDYTLVADKVTASNGTVTYTITSAEATTDDGTRCFMDTDGSWYAIDPMACLALYTLSESSAPVGYEVITPFTPVFSDMDDDMFEAVIDKLEMDAEEFDCEHDYLFMAEDVHDFREIPTPDEDPTDDSHLFFGFYKTDEKGSPLPGAEFTLTDKNGKTYTAYSDENGLVSFDIALSPEDIRVSGPASLASAAQLVQVYTDEREARELPMSVDGALTENVLTVNSFDYETYDNGDQKGYMELEDADGNTYEVSVAYTDSTDTTKVTAATAVSDDETYYFDPSENSWYGYDKEGYLASLTLSETKAPAGYKKIADFTPTLVELSKTDAKTAAIAEALDYESVEDMLKDGDAYTIDDVKDTKEPDASPSPSPSPSASPSPSPSTSPSPSASPSPVVSPEPSASPSPVVSPEPSTTPSPTATPAPEVSPWPSTAPTPAPSTSPSPSTSPAPGTSPAPSTSPAPGGGPNTADDTNLGVWYCLMAVCGICLIGVFAFGRRKHRG